MRFIDPIHPDQFEEWMKRKQEEYEKIGQYTYSLVVKEILRVYRSHKENERDCSGK